MRDAAALFFAIVIVGLLVIIAREHAPQPQLPVVAAQNVTCVPPMSHWQFRQRRIA
jgi:hypothetical protein